MNDRHTGFEADSRRSERALAVRYIAVGLTLGLVLGAIHVFVFSVAIYGANSPDGVNMGALVGNGLLHALLGGLPAGFASFVKVRARIRQGLAIRLRDCALGPAIVAVPAVAFFLVYGSWYFALAWVIACFVMGTLALFVATPRTLKRR